MGTQTQDSSNNNLMYTARLPGDAILCIYGAPVVNDKHPTVAVMAAVPGAAPVKGVCYGLLGLSSSHSLLPGMELTPKSEVIGFRARQSPVRIS